MNNQIFVHVPYPFLRDNLPLILERRINPEVFLPADVLDGLILPVTARQQPFTARSWT